MIPSVYALLSSDPTVSGLVGSKIYPAGRAPQGVGHPYVTWQLITATPENYVNDRSDIDAQRVQVNCWAREEPDARQVVEAARAALEGEAHVIYGPVQIVDDSTRDYGYAFDVQFWTSR